MKKPMRIATFEGLSPTDRGVVNFYWELISGSGSTLLTSEGYTRKASRNRIVAKAADELGLKVVDRGRKNK